MLRPSAFRPFYRSARFIKSQFIEPNSIHHKSLVLTGAIALLTLLSQQPVGGQLLKPDTQQIVIESQAHYSFSTPHSNVISPTNVVNTGASQPVIIERLDARAEDASAPAESLQSDSTESAPVQSGLVTHKALL